MPNDKRPLTYREAGVDDKRADAAISELAHLARSTYGPQVLSGIGGFAALYRLDNRMGLFRKRCKEPLLVACADGVGTKLKIAFALDKHDTVGIDLVAMSVNDLVTTAATPLFFLDYFVAGTLDGRIMLEVMKGVTAGCLEAGCALIGGETAEHPGCYPPGEYDLAGFCVGIADRRKVFDPARIIPGDAVVAVASSGLHSNGFSLVRKALLERAGMSLGDTLPELGGKALGEELLTPTRIYAKAVRAVLARYKVKEVVKGIAHITGGGMLGNIPRILPKNIDVEIQRSALKPPPIFGIVQKAGEIEDGEMFRVFNMGVGMALICSSYYAAAIVRTLKSRRVGEEAYIIGRTLAGTGQVRIG